MTSLSTLYSQTVEKSKYDYIMGGTLSLALLDYVIVASIVL